MSKLTNFGENALVDFFMRAQAAGLPADWHVGLVTAIGDAETASVTEVSGGAYARVAVTRSLAAFSGTQGAGSTTASSGTSGQSSNNAGITFPAPTANWGTVIGVGLWDAASGGNLWVLDNIRNSDGAAITRTILNGDDAPSFAAGSLRLTIA
jgi:hypothetical protein